MTGYVGQKIYSKTFGTGVIAVVLDKAYFGSLNILAMFDRYHPLLHNGIFDIKDFVPMGDQYRWVEFGPINCEGADAICEYYVGIENEDEDFDC